MDKTFYSTIAGVFIALLGVLVTLRAARQELGFPIDAEEYSKIISEATAAAQTSVKSLLQEVREQVLLKIQ